MQNSLGYGLSDRPLDLEFQMRPELRRIRYIISAVLIVFCMIMIGVLINNRETSFFEYLIWLGGIGFWIYLIWTTMTARLLITSKGVKYSSGREHVSADWEEIRALKYLSNGPALFVGEDLPSASNRKRQDHRPKVPLYLFMARWATIDDWQADPLGSAIVQYLPRLFSTSTGENS